MTDEQKEFIKERKDSKMSSGEKRVSNFLKERNIIFEREFFFEELINPNTGNLLFFDFYLSKENICIEVDGAHHFKAIDGKAELQYQKYKDGLKNKFCQQNKITIIRLRYKKNGRVDISKLKDWIDGRWERTVVVTKKIVPIEKPKQNRQLVKQKRARKSFKFRKNDKYKKVVVVWDEEKGFTSPVISEVDERIRLRAERRMLYANDFKNNSNEKQANNSATI